jgi:protein-S-isoprenylcysteine O-methyltransferase Ste14
MKEDFNMKYFAAFYGTLSYLVFLVSFLYAIGFVGNLWVPKSIDAPLGASGWIAFTIDAIVLGLFAIQHSVMARPAFKRRWTRVIPEAIERSTYVLFSSLLLDLIFIAWQPLPLTVWAVSGELAKIVLTALYGLGWLIVLLSTFMISHFELFGLTQVWRRLRGSPMGHASFKVVLLYRFVRHPIMLGFLIAFWSTPVMTVGHLLFALLTTGYILVGVQLEEHDLQKAFGAAYANYRRRVPMLIPLLRRFPATSEVKYGADRATGRRPL